MPPSSMDEAASDAGKEDHHTLLGHARTSTAPEWQRRSYRLPHVLLSAIAGAAAAAAATILLLTLLISVTADRPSPTPPKHFYPDLPFTSPTTFNEDPKYVNGSWQEEFAKLLPHEHGFVRVPEPRRYNLHGGFPLPGDAESYSISLFHQLHCVLALKQDFGDLLAHPPAGAAAAAAAVSAEDVAHANHCFEYLRQALMCAGDLTLEKMKVDARGRPVRDVIGWGVTHYCKDWGKVMEWADRHGDQSVREGEIAEHHLHGGGSGHGDGQ